MLCFRRNRKKSSESLSGTEARLYMREDLVRERIIDADFTALVCLPPSIDSHEWIATHSQSWSGFELFGWWDKCPPVKELIPPVK